MSKDVPSGYYRDSSGSVRRDRRLSTDRRSPKGTASSEERRLNFRRRADREVVAEREYDEMIEEALEEFAADHQH